MDQQTRRVMTHIADRLTRVQRSRNLSITELARRSKIDKSALELILRGEKDLEIVTIFRVAAALEIAPAVLLQGIEWIPDEEGGGGRFEIDERDAG